MWARASFSLKAGFVISATMGCIALLAPVLAPYDPYATNPTIILEAPSASHWLGTDSIGRDVFSRVIYGARASLSVAAAISLISVGLGAILGAASALAGGWIDTLAMRFADVMLSLPALVIALALSAVLGPNLTNLALILGTLGIPFFARIFRSEALSLSQQNFIRSSRLLGGGFNHLLMGHIIPNLAPLLATLLSHALSTSLLAASALSFIGLGAQPPTAEWGALIYEGRNTLMFEWWCAIPPGITIAISATGFILLGDGLRDALDPRSEPQ